MKIAIVSKLWEPTSPESTGGTGAAIGNLVNGLSARGHEVTLFATGNSKTKAKELVAVREYPYANDYSEIQEFDNIASAFKREEDFDIIHLAVEHKSLFFSGIGKTPVLHSIRYGEFFDQEMEILKKYSQENFVGISEAIANKFKFLNFQGIIYNGVNLQNFPWQEKSQDYLVFLARVSPQKGPHLAIKLAKELNKKLIIAGKISDSDKEYLDKHFWPYIDNEQIIYKGELGFNEKIELLRNAKCLLHPIENIFEAFGMSLIEAQALGTPVVSYDNGSPLEVINQGKTGYVVKNYDEMIEAVKNIDKIKRKDCREWVERMFSLDKMLEAYEDLYNKIIDK
ncbi:glycosyltransferase family 4 protein [Patescibacteria group bacterium]|nr:glycosyltransferase family 4 protein [Patescibacteria group bacterium]